MYAPTAGSIRFAGEEIAGLPANRICHKGIGRTYQIPRPFRNLTLLENVALSAWFGQHGKTDRAACWRQAEEALGAGRACRPTPRTTTTGSAPPPSRSWSWRARWPPSPSCCWPTRASTASTTPRWSRRPTCCSASAARRGITIVWVEHIMGVLMRVVDRVVVLDHGEMIFDGAPKAAQSDPRVVEVYLGADAVA